MSDSLGNSYQLALNLIQKVDSKSSKTVILKTKLDEIFKNMELEVMDIVNVVKENSKDDKQIIPDVTINHIETLHDSKIEPNDKLIGNTNENLSETNNEILEIKNSQEQGTSLKPYDEYYFETRQLMVNLMYYKKSDTSIQLNHRPLLEMPSPTTNWHDSSFISLHLKNVIQFNI